MLTLKDIENKPPKYYHGTWCHYLDAMIEDMTKAGYTYKEAEDIIRNLYLVGLVVDKRSNNLTPYDGTCYLKA